MHAPAALAELRLQPRRLTAENDVPPHLDGVQGEAARVGVRDTQERPTRERSLDPT
jgi:hypothetical protein